MTIKIQYASIKDLESIINILNQAILSKNSVAYLSPIKVKEKINWFKEYDKNEYPIIVAEENDEILEWLSLSPYRPGRLALRFTAEVSIFIHNKYQLQGIGSQLLDFILKNYNQYHIKTLFAILFDSNKGSIKLFKKFGFEKWGHLPIVADFDGKEIGHFYYGLRLVE